MNSNNPQKREQAFVLDCVAVSSASSGYECIRPKLWSVIPPYITLNDPYTKRYSIIPAVKRAMDKIGHKEQRSRGTERVLRLRNEAGAGHSREQVSNHGDLMGNLKPYIGYNGELGYRRNTPRLRQNPSSFMKKKKKKLPLSDTYK